jgi:Lrp/AsnC family transcriptional regulator for asnA, asnC and gidA
MKLDDIDRAILRELQADARTPFSEIADAIDMSSAAVHDRVSKLEDAGVLEGYRADINPEAAGYGTAALVGLRVEHGHIKDVIPALRELEFVRGIHLVAGTLDIVVRVQATDNESLRESIFDGIGEIEGIHRTNSMVILQTFQDESSVPL